VILLNATAQVALSHHLDDLRSQQMSVAANALVARQTTGELSANDPSDHLVINAFRLRELHREHVLVSRHGRPPPGAGPAAQRGAGE
jgi:hypothetical protein